MRIYHKEKQIGHHNKTFFALWPIRIGNETRWLEKVTVLCNGWIGCYSGDYYVDEIEFVDKPNKGGIL